MVPPQRYEVLQHNAYVFEYSVAHSYITLVFHSCIHVHGGIRLFTRGSFSLSRSRARARAAICLSLSVCVCVFQPWAVDLRGMLPKPIQRYPQWG
jgi:hypothetical protein